MRFVTSLYLLLVLWLNHTYLEHSLDRTGDQEVLLLLWHLATVTWPAGQVLPLLAADQDEFLPT